MTSTEFTLLTTILMVAVIAAAVNVWLSRSKYELSFSPGLLLAMLLIPFIRIMLPFEFPFTKTIKSDTILPLVYDKLSAESVFAKLPGFQVFMFAWLLGAGLSFLIKVIQYYRITLCFRYLPNCADAETEAFIANYLRLRNMKQRHIKLVCSGCICEPIVYGAWNPVIVVPEKIFSDPIVLRDVLLHEINHYIFGDLLFKWILEFLSSFYWFVWPVRKLKKHIYNLMEIRADHYAVSSKSNEEKAAYLKILLSTHMEKQKTAQLNPFAVATFSYGNGHSLMRRFNAISNMEQSMDAKRKNAFILLAVLLLVISVSYSFVFQPYALRDNAKDTFNISEGNYYLKPMDGGGYGLYIADKYICQVNTLDEELSKLPIIND